MIKGSLVVEWPKPNQAAAAREGQIGHRAALDMIDSHLHQAYAYADRTIHAHKPQVQLKSTK